MKSYSSSWTTPEKHKQCPFQCKTGTEQSALLCSHGCPSQKTATWMPWFWHTINRKFLLSITIAVRNYSSRASLKFLPVHKLTEMHPLAQTTSSRAARIAVKIPWRKFLLPGITESSWKHKIHKHNHIKRQEIVLSKWQVKPLHSKVVF